MSASTSRGNGSVAPPFVHADPRCKVCNSERRAEIDAMLRDGHTQVVVRRHFNNLLGTDFFTANNLSVHARKHLYGADADDWIRMTARARKVLGDPNAVPSETRPEEALRTVMEVGLKMIDAGVSVPETADVIRASKELRRMEREGQFATERELLHDLNAFTAAVKANVPEEKWEAIWNDFAQTLGIE